MEDSLVESLHCIRIHKFDNELHLRPSMGGTQETQTPSWFPNGEQEHAAVEELKFLPHGDVECSRDASLSNYCGFFGIGKQADFDNAEQVDDQRQVGDALDELSSTQHLRPLNEKCSCHLCSTLNFPEVEKPAETDLPVSPSGYKVDRTFEVPGPV
ncbi:hypothetical protein RJ639_025786 [Escallonia herrerae]|uniref:Uncharacterized protein n=1 Tax=Escallonia herrerae TaxID=1293975 RepID=A0AA88UX31_9ASTE|nr:hypothetical protein RJ639_025786 [Escallonia herrerae]